MIKYTFQFPWCVGEFNLIIFLLLWMPHGFQFPWCVGEFNINVRLSEYKDE